MLIQEYKEAVKLLRSPQEALADARRVIGILNFTGKEDHPSGMEEFKREWSSFVASTLSSSPTLTIAQTQVEPLSNQKESDGGMTVDASVLRASLTNLRWEKDSPKDGLLEQWVLKGDSPLNQGPLTVIIAKKQGEGQWRTSFHQGTFPSVSSFNAESLNRSARLSLHAVKSLMDQELPWLDGSVFSESISAAAQAMADAALAPEPEYPPIPTPKARKPRVSSRAAVAGRAVALDYPPPDSTPDVPATPMVEKKEKVKISSYKSHFAYKEGHKMSALDLIVESATHGAKVGLADEAGEATLGIAEAIFGEHYPDMAKTARGRSIMKAVSGGLTLFVADKYPEMFGSLAEGAKAGAGMVIEAAARDLVQPEMKKITPLIKQLAEVGAAQMKSVI